MTVIAGAAEVRITCVQATDEEAVLLLDPRLAVGSKVTATLADADGREIVSVRVPVTTDTQYEDPEVLAGVALAAQGWALGECGPDWWDAGDGPGSIWTAGVATRPV